MYRIRLFALAAVIAAGLASPATAANPPAGKSTLMKKLFGPSGPKPAGPTARTGTPGRPVTISTLLAPDQLAEALQAEQEAYLRRVSVCTELRRVAVERGDDTMVRQADELERQFGALYNARVAALGVSRAKSPLPEPTSSIAGLDSPPRDPVSARLAARKLEAPPAPVAGPTTAQVREVKP